MIDPLAAYAAGDVMLDASGNVILDASGNVLLDDGSGNSCCCCLASCPNCSGLPSSVVISGWNGIANGDTTDYGYTGATLNTWDGTVGLSLASCPAGTQEYLIDRSSFNLSCATAYGCGAFEGLFSDGATRWVSPSGPNPSINCGPLSTATGQPSGTYGWTITLSEIDAVAKPSSGKATMALGASYYKLGCSPIGTYLLYNDNTGSYTDGHFFTFPSTLTVS